MGALLVEEVGDANMIFAALLLLFILIASLTVMNMLVGVLVEVVSVVSAVEKEQINVAFAKKQVEKMLAHGDIDKDGDNLISKDEFKHLLDSPVAMRALH